MCHKSRTHRDRARTSGHGGCRGISRGASRAGPAGGPIHRHGRLHTGIPHGSLWLPNSQHTTATFWRPLRDRLQQRHRHPPDQEDRPCARSDEQSSHRLPTATRPSGRKPSMNLEWTLVPLPHSSVDGSADSIANDPATVPRTAVPTVRGACSRQSVGQPSRRRSGRGSNGRRLSLGALLACDWPTRSAVVPARQDHRHLDDYRPTQRRGSGVFTRCQIMAFPLAEAR
jgi:hypothetical protein